ncbi:MULTISPECIES: hypothetical protein [unclassified Enterococcus]|uniref:hypothetical protein n=1 Tax=unclassified Enterococcus TaxID=2608891 RepID=UPI003F2403BF
MDLKQVARRELFRITDEELNPGWYKDPKLLERRDKLLNLLGMPNEQRRLDESLEDYQERMAILFFSIRPGLEDKVIALLKDGKPMKQIEAELGVPMKNIRFLRKKYL